MNILHLTDLHFSEKGKSPLNIIKAIVSKIKLEDIHIDFVFFTGDIVNIGADNAQYENAIHMLFDTLSSELDINPCNFIICPGNHDIDRSKISKSLKSYFNTEIRDNLALNKFYKAKDNDYQNSLAPLAPYRKYAERFYEGRGVNELNELYSIHFREYKGKKLAIVGMYTPWVSALFGEEDKGNLLLPTDVLSEIVDTIRDSDVKIILMHHPVYFLKEYNSYEVENIIHSKFNMLFSGHIHKISSLSRHSGTNGIFEHVAMASLTSDGEQGCSVISVDDIEDNKIVVREIVYSEAINACNIGEPINYTIPCGDEKMKILNFRKKLHDKIAVEIDNANKLLLIDNDENGHDFLSLYNHPVIKTEAESNLESKHGPIISMDELINATDNYYILGKDKCGKTSLLKRIQIEILMNFNRNGKVPFYIDARDCENKVDDKFSIVDLVREYYGVNRSKAIDIVDSEDFILLIDNYDPDKDFASYLMTVFLPKYTKLRFIACSEECLYRKVETSPFGDIGANKLYFHNLRRQELAQYTEKRLPASVQQRDRIQEKIISICKQLELPLNYWTISLLLLINHKSSESYAKNLFSILDACVDEIFNKKQILLSRSKISYEQLKKVCANLAQRMFEGHASTVYSISKDEMLGYLDEMIEENDRLTISAQGIFDYLCKSGIIKERFDDRRYVFRLNGFFEYFLAYQMTKDNTFKDSIINNDEMFIAFKNQIEIYSGFKRDDYDFLSSVYNKVAKKVNPIWEQYDSNLDDMLLTKIKTQKEIEDFCKSISVERTLSAVEKATLQDQFEEPTFDSDVHLVPKVDTTKLTFEMVERYMSILARTYRSSDEILGKSQEKREIFHYILNGYCKLGFYLVDELKRSVKTEYSSTFNQNIDFRELPEIKLLNFISNFTPLICQVALYDGIGHFSLERIIKKEIESIIKSDDIEEYRLFMLCFLLLDIDLEGNKEYIRTAMQYIKMNVLKYAIVVKLNYYLAFNAGDNKSMQNMLSQNIQRARINLDNTTSLSDIEQQIQVRKRENLINQNK